MQVMPKSFQPVRAVFSSKSTETRERTYGGPTQTPQAEWEEAGENKRSCYGNPLKIVGNARWLDKAVLYGTQGTIQEQVIGNYRFYLILKLHLRTHGKITIFL